MLLFLARLYQEIKHGSKSEGDPRKRKRKNTNHVIFRVNDLKGSVSHTDQRLICTDLKKIQEE